MNENLVGSVIIQEAYNIRVLNQVTAHTIVDIGKFSVRKVFSAISILVRIIGQMFSFRPDIVYFTMSPSGFAFYRDAFYLFIIRLFRTKLVLHFHGKGISEGAQKSRLFRFLCRNIFRGSYTIHMSERLVKDLQGFPVRKTFIVPYGLPDVTKNPIHKEYGGTVRLLFLSNYVKTKGVLDLVEAVRKVAAENRNFHLDLVGKPYDVSMEELQRLTREYGLEDVVSVCGPRYGQEKFETLSKAQVFIFPTYYFNEAFPIALLEAMQFGLACITTREGGIPDMIDDNVNGYLVDHRDVQALAEKILLLLRSPEMIQSMGVNARKKFCEKYTLDFFEQNMKATFDDILNDRR
ncbi:MAG: glycosyltransferase family 4 protein [Flavisolibacter sp.]